MPRKFPSRRSLDRKLGDKSPKVLFKVVCEGKNTEPNYLKEFSAEFGNDLVKVETIGAAGVPLTIVKKAVDLKRSVKYKKNKNGFEGLSEFWAVFDYDEHPNIPQALNIARDNQVFVAKSNPCFEIWPLLHFVFQRAPIDRHKLQSELSKHMKNYSKNGSKDRKSVV